MKSDPRGALGGDYWAVAAYLAIPAIAVLLVAAALPPAEPLAPPRSNDDAITELVRSKRLALQAWPQLLAELCRDPALVEVGLAPSCSEAVITLPDGEFFDRDARALRPEAMRRIAAGIPVLLERLRAKPQVFQQLESIEVRGHADPWAFEDPYITNLHASQQRALAVVAFLTTDRRIPEADRLDLQRLALSSGASFSRPPEGCEVRSRECDKRSKRVEIRIVLNAERLRADIGAFYDELSDTLAR